MVDGQAGLCMGRCMGGVQGWVHGVVHGCEVGNDVVVVWCGGGIIVCVLWVTPYRMGNLRC